ncbi:MULTISPECIES: YafY family protein [Nocardiaceae]|uniref:DNA-binding transcriptional regulator YafY n=1 Tax=Rhodococcoides corynebacterioides TaxID=53972 RepID=A0ABS2KYW8_9NOCA|nr:MULTISPECIES: WYL domain-containing protein [Rhodococcus]MBM7417131.1 putative DNA-binding transcriptional regulator YafY [Rhodococcus corynebacterioides]MBP1115384.1 putative DNA-binding transcriptional regulator YafY [Rhodococcus sp. PvP016]
MTSSRLLSLLLLLQTRHRITTGELAERLEVSRRTVLRDVDALSAAGVPVYAERGRHGGIVLLPGARLNASYLEPAEMDAMTLAGLDEEQRERLGVTGTHDMAMRKIAARRAGVEAAGRSLADLVVVDNTSWFALGRDVVNVGDLALELRFGRRLLLRYRRSGAPAADTVVVDPYGLAAKAGRWYLVADVGGHGRLFALARVDGYEVLAESSHRRSVGLRGVWSELSAAVEAPGDVVVTARLRSSRTDLAQRVLGSRITASEPAGDGWTQMSIGYSTIEGVRQLLQFADHIEVVEPQEARTHLAELAADLARRHS